MGSLESMNQLKSRAYETNGVCVKKQRKWHPLKPKNTNTGGLALRCPQKWEFCVSGRETD